MELNKIFDALAGEPCKISYEKDGNVKVLVIDPANRRIAGRCKAKDFRRAK